MQTTGSVKVGASFLAGIMVALGGALIYFRASDSHAQPAVEVSATDESGSVMRDPAAAPKASDPVPVTVASPDVAKPRLQLKSPAKLRVTSRPVSLAVWHPKATPAEKPITQALPAAPLELPPPPDATVTPEPALERLVLPPQPHVVTIPAGTTLAVRVNEKLSTEHNFTGDTFRATLDSPIILEGFIIADRGAKVLGRIVKAQKPGRLQGMAELSLALTEISTTDGQRVEVATNESLRKGASNTNEELVKMAGGAALGAIIGAIAGAGKGAAIGAGAGSAAGTGAVLLGHGKPAVIEDETRLTFELANPTTVTEHLN